MGLRRLSHRHSWRKLLTLQHWILSRDSPFWRCLGSPCNETRDDGVNCRLAGVKFNRFKASMTKDDSDDVVNCPSDHHHHPYDLVLPIINRRPGFTPLGLLLLPLHAEGDVPASKDGR